MCGALKISPVFSYRRLYRNVFSIEPEAIASLPFLSSLLRSFPASLSYEYFPSGEIYYCNFVTPTKDLFLWLLLSLVLIISFLAGHFVPVVVGVGRNQSDAILCYAVHIVDRRSQATC